jgi:hypothetical protein
VNVGYQVMCQIFLAIGGSTFILVEQLAKKSFQVCVLPDDGTDSKTRTIANSANHVQHSERCGDPGIGVAKFEQNLRGSRHTTELSGRNPHQAGYSERYL